MHRRAGVLALAAFVVSSGAGRPAGSAELFADHNVPGCQRDTLLVYGRARRLFLVLVLQLQTVAGFSPSRPARPCSR